MFRRVKKWASKIDKFIPKSSQTNVSCLVTTVEGQDYNISVDKPETLLQVLRREGFDISSYCGGMCSCGTCIVDVEGGQTVLTPISSREVAVLGFSNKVSSRLACQAKFQGEGTVHITLRRVL